MKYILGAIFLVTLGCISDASACSCAPWENAEQMLKEADAVVLAIPSEQSTIDPSIPAPYVSVQKTGMKILRHFKGKYKKFFYLFTEVDTGANCGVNFKENDGVYLIFSYKDNGKYRSDSCSLSIIDPELTEVTKILSDLTN